MYRKHKVAKQRLSVLTLLLVFVGQMLPAFVQMLQAATTANTITPALPTFQPVATFQAASDFESETGKVGTQSVYLNWKDHAAGYLLSALKIDGNRGVVLGNGLYRFKFKLRRGSEPAVVKIPGAPVFTVSVWDVTTNEMLVERQLHISDFKDADTYYNRSLNFSTLGREQHRFEPRVYWHDYVDAAVETVTLEQSVSHSLRSLEEKAHELNALVQSTFLDPIGNTSEQGMIVARNVKENQPAHRGDSVTWTALYTAAMAHRLMVNPRDMEALAHMEKGFRAMHRMHEITGEPGVVARFADVNGNWKYEDKCDPGKLHSGPGRPQQTELGAPVCRLEQTTCIADAHGRKRSTCPDKRKYYEEWGNELISEDIYSGFAFAVSTGYPLISDPNLKAAIANDMKAIARNLLQNDFKIVKAAAPGGKPKVVNFNPYLTSETIRETIAKEIEKDGMVGQLQQVYYMFQLFRHGWNIIGSLNDTLVVISLGCLRSFPSLPGNLLPPVNAELEMALEKKDADAIVRLLPDFARQLRGSLIALKTFLADANGYLQAAVDCVGRLPNSDVGEKYRDLLRLVRDHIVPELDQLIAKIPTQINTIEDLKFDASNSIAAAHLLRAASMVAPQEFNEPYYRFLLGGGKDLLQTAETWTGVNEKFAKLVGGDQGADKQRSATNWKSYAALYSLIRLETRADIKDRFRALLERSWTESADEGNAFYDVIRAASGVRAGQRPADRGQIAWALAQIPVTRTGYSKEAWNSLNGPDLANLVGDILSWDSNEAKGVLRDPAPVGLAAHHDIFFWQRNRRSIGFNPDADGIYFPGVDYLLPYYIGRAAGLALDAPSTVVTTNVRTAAFLKSSGELGLTLGRGAGATCKTLGGVVRTPSELGTLPGPYGQVKVGANGARLANGYVRVRVLVHHNANLTVNVQPDGVHYWLEICRRSAFQTEAEAKFAVDIVAPATTKSDNFGKKCPASVVASSGEQGVTLGSGWSSNTKDLHLRVNLPAGVDPLGGKMGTFQLDGNGYDDEHVRVRVLVYQRVTAFQITKDAAGVSLWAQIKRPSRNKGGAEIKVAVELLATKAKTFRVVPSAQTLNFSAPEGQQTASQTVQVQAADANCDLGFKTWTAAFESDSGNWLYLAPAGGTLPGELRVRPSADGLVTSATPYRGRIRIDAPGATNTPQYIAVSFTVSGRTQPLPPILPKPAQLKITVDGKGEVRGTGVSCTSNCSVNFPAATMLSLDAVAAPGYRFQQWSGACSGQQTQCVARVDGVTAVAAKFVPVEQTPQARVVLTALSDKWFAMKLELAKKDGLSNHALFEIAKQATGPWTNVCAIPTADAGWLHCTFTGLTPNAMYYVRVSDAARQHVLAPVVGAVQTKAAAKASAAVGTAALFEEETHLRVEQPIEEDSNLNAATTVEIANSANGPWVRKCGPLTGHAPALCRIHGLKPGDVIWVRVTTTDPDGTTGTATQVLGPVSYRGLENLALGRPIVADAGWGCCAQPAQLLDGIIQYPAWSNGFAWTGGTARWAGGAPGWKQAVVDLGALRTINRVDLWSHNDFHVPLSTRVEVSKDGKSWTTVYQSSAPQCRTATGALMAGWDFPSCGQAHKFAATEARYVRYSFDDRELLEAGIHGWAVELEVFGPPPALR